MPAFMAVFVALGAEESSAWRMALIVPAVLFLCVGTFVWMCCDDCPQGKYEDLKRPGELDKRKKKVSEAV